MLGRIVEIAEDMRQLSLYRGFLVVSGMGERGGEGKEGKGSSYQELARIPLDDISAVIANAHGLSYTNNCLVALAERGVPFVLCAANHNVAGMLLPIEGNFEQAKRMDAQIAATEPTKKRLWMQVVKAKIIQQSAVLAAVGREIAVLVRLANCVKSGDPENLEAQAARYYWQTLFGSTFRRDMQASGINALLNYGYTILRAAMARAVVAAGLHPTLGMHHSNAGNPMRLVDDLMEPFRPLVDWVVWRITQTEEVATLTPIHKRALVQVLSWDMASHQGVTPVMVAMQTLSTSLSKVYTGDIDRSGLLLPAPLERFPD